MLAIATSSSVSAFPEPHLNRAAVEDESKGPQNSFSPSLQKTVNDLAGLLAKPIVFKESTVYSLTLDGADGTFSPIDDAKLLSPPPDKDASKATPTANGVVNGVISPPPSPTTIKAEFSLPPITSSGREKQKDNAPREDLPKRPSLWPNSISTEWPKSADIGIGFTNTGNTCFLNSVLQCLLHTPQFLQILLGHDDASCRVSGFCMICSCRQVATVVYGTGTNRPRWTRPSPILGNLQYIAKQMRRGHQEDAHEFLRYSIDALQKSALAGLSPKIPPKLAETTWVHRIFGGRLRSRVMCKKCGHPSDTYDSILDLSLDIHECDSVKDALKEFVAVDRLSGADKYNCEKCKKPVVAEKSFTIHDAPQVLTVHLKRFTPTGRKYARQVDFDEKLSLEPFMSEGQYGPKYTLYAIISHAGSGPNSGHYYAHVKSSHGKWHEMNDENVSFTHSPPLGQRNAYILFYRREKNDILQEALSRNLNGIPATGKELKKRPRESDDEDLGEGVSQSIGGPFGENKTGPSNRDTSPSPPKRARPTLIPSTPFPAATALAQKIKAVSQPIASTSETQKSPAGREGDALPAKPIVDYAGSDSDVEGPPKPPPQITSLPPKSSLSALAPTSFYASSTSSSNLHKRKLDNARDQPQKRRPSAANPFSKGLTGGSDDIGLLQRRDSDKQLEKDLRPIMKTYGRSKYGRLAPFKRKSLM